MFIVVYSLIPLQYGNDSNPISHRITARVEGL